MGKFTDITHGPKYPTYNTERLPGKAQSSLPASVAAAAASTPDPDDVLQTENHDHYKLLQDARQNNIKQENKNGNTYCNNKSEGLGINPGVAGD